MKKTLPSFWRSLLTGLLLLAGAFRSQATHIQGGQLTYLNVGTNQYVVTLYLYRDCSGSTLPTNMSLTVQNGCNGVSAGTYQMDPVPNSVAVGTQYCAAQQPQAQCTGTATLPNYETQQYRTATITIAPGQWLLSTEICCRPSSANLVGQDNFRYEATLNNRITVNGQFVTVQNSSPQYSAQDVPVPFVPNLQSTTIGFNTTDPDNTSLNPNADSLVYSLATPLNGCGTSVPYNPYPGALPVQVPGSNPPCYILPPTNTPPNYTATLPIAVSFNTTGTCPILQGTTAKFSFSPSAGQFTFTPGRYLNTAPGNGDNKYVVVGKVSEYRRLPGSNRRYLVGSVRREIFVIVTNNTNGVPAAPTGTPVTPGSGTTVVTRLDSLDVTIQPCNYSQVLVRFTDPDPADLLTVQYTGQGTINTNILESGDIGTYTLLGNNTPTPVARFLFQPSPAYSGRVLRIPFLIQDNACPVRGLQTRVLIVRIANIRRDLATSAAAVGAPGLGNTSIASVCLGGTLQLRGAVNRPDSTNGRLQTYNYAWTGNGIVGAANTANITVAPLVTTRYRLDVNPASGFQTGVCADTSSILVRVVPQPVATATASVPKVCAGTSVLLRGVATRADQLTDTYTYRWSGPGVPANTTGATLTVNPVTVGINTYTLTATGASPYGCAATTTVAVEVVAPPRVAVSTTNVYLCPGGTATLQATATAPQGFTDTYTFRFSPANGLASSDETKANPTVRPTITTRYRVTASGNPVTGCADTASVLVRVLPGVTADFATADSVGLNGQRTNRPPVVFSFRNASVVSGQAQGSTTTYKWTYERIRDIGNTPVSGTETAFGNGAATPGPLQLGVSGYYRIRLTTTVSVVSGGTTVSCQASVRERIVLVPDLEVPNVITPNGDGKNDVFKISTASTTTRIEIFNRWGRKVYEQGDYQNNWGGDNQPAGVYYYMLTFKNGSQSKGWLEVMR